MSGGGGGPIILPHIKAALSNPIVYGSLPADIQMEVGQVLAKDWPEWTVADKDIIAEAVSWAVRCLA